MSKVSLITGSSRGIGRHIALKLAQQKYTLIITGRNQADIEQTCHDITQLGARALALKADLATEAGLQFALQFLEQNKLSLDLLVCNIGSGKSANTPVVDMADWRNMFEINFFSTVMAYNTFYPKLVASKGHIVCISSIAGVEKLFTPTTYSVAKAAVISFVKQMMRPLAEVGVRINCVSPGLVWADHGSWQRRMKENPEFVQNIIQNEIPFKKFVQADEVADAVWFLESNLSMTGQNIVLDNGHTRQT